MFLHGNNSFCQRRTNVTFGKTRGSSFQTKWCWVSENDRKVLQTCASASWWLAVWNCASNLWPFPFRWSSLPSSVCCCSLSWFVQHCHLPENDGHYNNPSGSLHPSSLLLSAPHQIELTLDHHWERLLCNSITGSNLVAFIHFWGEFEVRFLHIAAVRCNQMCSCDGVRHQEEDGLIINK